MNSHEQNNAAIPIIFIFGLLIAGFIYWVAEQTGLDFVTTANVFGRLIAVMVLTGVIAYFWRTLWVLPVLTAGSYISLFPAFDYWSQQHFPFHSDQYMWYANGWIQLFITGGIVAITVCVIKLIQSWES